MASPTTSSKQAAGKTTAAKKPKDTKPPVPDAKGKKKGAGSGAGAKPEPKLTQAQLESAINKALPGHEPGVKRLAVRWKGTLTETELAARTSNLSELKSKVLEAWAGKGPSEAKRFVQEYGSLDKIAVQKFRDLDKASPADFEGGKVGAFRQAYYLKLATLIRELKPKRTNIYSVMQAPATPFRAKGKRIPAKLLGDFAKRTQGVGSVWQWSVKPDVKTTIAKEEMVAAAGKGSWSELQASLEASGKTPESELASDQVKRVAKQAWKRKLATGRPLLSDVIPTAKLSGGHTWFTPDKVKVSGGEAGFAELMEVFALQPEWFADGTALLTIDTAAKGGLADARKPTVFDGMQSALWVSRTGAGQTFGVTGGGVREYLAKDVQFSAVTNASVQSISESYSTELAALNKRYKTTLTVPKKGGAKGETVQVPHPERTSATEEALRGNLGGPDDKTVSAKAKQVMGGVIDRTTREQNDPTKVAGQKQASASAVAKGGVYDRGGVGSTGATTTKKTGGTGSGGTGSGGTGAGGGGAATKTTGVEKAASKAKKSTGGADKSATKPKESGGADKSAAKPKESGGADKSATKPKESGGADKSAAKPKESVGADKPAAKAKDGGGADKATANVAQSHTAQTVAPEAQVVADAAQVTPKAKPKPKTTPESDSVTPAAPPVMSGDVQQEAAKEETPAAEEPKPEANELSDPEVDPVAEAAAEAAEQARKTSIIEALTTDVPKAAEQWGGKVATRWGADEIAGKQLKKTEDEPFTFTGGAVLDKVGTQAAAQMRSSVDYGSIYERYFKGNRKGVKSKAKAQPGGDTAKAPAQVVTSELYSWLFGKKGAGLRDPTLTALGEPVAADLKRQAEEGADVANEQIRAQVDGIHFDLEDGVYGGFHLPSARESDHTRFKPEDLQVHEGNGATRVTYTTNGGEQGFSAVVGDDGMQRSILGFNLTLKGSDDPQGRGKTEDAGRFEKNMGMNRSHLIADQFKGSGYKESGNLITASDHFNKEVMASLERRIRDHIIAFGDGLGGASEVTFNMKVNVEWGKVVTDSVVEQILSSREFREAYAHYRGSNIKTLLEQKVAAYGDEKLQRCMNVHYDVLPQATGPDGTLIRGAPLLLDSGPDLWMFLSKA